MRKCRALGGNISAIQGAKGVANDVVPGSRAKTPGEELSRGIAQGVRMKLAGGGGHNEKYKIAVRRNDILGEPHLKRGGKAKGMAALYKALHSRFEKSPQMKALGATKANVYAGEPHRESKSQMCKAGGGHMWIQKAIKNKGSLHKALGISSDKKIPLIKLKKAEHSRSPLLRKRANLAQTLRTFRK